MGEVRAVGDDGRIPESGAPAIEVRGLVRRFGDVTAVAGIDLRVQRGECVGLLGPNGAGKTTTVEILQGLQTQDDGEVLVLGRRWDREGTALRERIGVCLQETKLPELLTVGETVELFASFYQRPMPVTAALATVQLEDRLGVRVGHLSGGQRQRLAVALALVGSPDVLFLDEPTTGLDPQSRRLLWDAVLERKRQGCTVVLTTHFMEEAEALCDRVIIVDHGRILAEGSPRTMVNAHAVEHFIELELHPVIDRARLLALPGVTVVHERDGRLSVGARELAQVLPRIFRLLQDADVELRHLSTRAATLDDVFLELTGRSLREEKAA